ncbi:MAG: PKD domain-containing protein [Patescibacteria group bacterium]
MRIQHICERIHICFLALFLAALIVPQPVFAESFLDRVADFFTDDEEFGEEVELERVEDKVSAPAVPARPGAGEPYRRYCPDPTTDFFKGSIYYENDRAWIEVAVDPAFEAKMVRERNLTAPLPLTPVFDLIVRIKPEFNYYCIPGWVEGGKEVTAEQLPQTVSVNASIVVGEKDEEMTIPGFLFRTDNKDRQGRFIYEQKIKGWPNGIASDAKLERLIGAVAKQEPVNALVKARQSTGEIKAEKSSITFDNCVPLWGSGRHAMVYMRGSSSVAAFPISRFQTVVGDDIYGFRSLEPFAKYSTPGVDGTPSGYFSHYLDLLPHDDSWYIRQMRILNTKQRVNNLLSLIPRSSTCKAGSVYLLHADGELRMPRGSFDGFASIGNGVVLLKASAPYRTALHEVGHAFANLVDQYYQAEIILGLPAYTNCTTDATRDFTFNGKRYGLSNQPVCTGRYAAPGASPGELVSASRLQLLFRPSKHGTGMMDNPPTNGFDVVSCGWIIAATKGGDAHSYFPECAKMDGVIKDGVQASVPHPFFAWLDNFNPEAYGPQAAAIGASDTGSAANGSYLIVESFDPDNPWGEIIPINDEEEGGAAPPSPAAPNSFEFERNSKGTFEFSLVAPDGDTLFKSELVTPPFGSYAPRPAFDQPFNTGGTLPVSAMDGRGGNLGTGNIGAGDVGTEASRGGPARAEHAGGLIQRAIRYFTAPRGGAADTLDEDGFESDEEFDEGDEEFGFNDDEGAFGNTGAPLPNAAPVVVEVAVPASVVALEGTRFSVSANDPDGTALSVRVDWGDGSALSYEEISAHTKGESATAEMNHAFAATGSYRASFSVSDGKGGVDTLNRTIVVRASAAVSAPPQQPTSPLSPTSPILDSGNQGAPSAAGNQGAPSADGEIRFTLDGKSGALAVPAGSSVFAELIAPSATRCSNSFGADERALRSGVTIGPILKDAKYSVTCGSVRKEVRVGVYENN